MKEIGKQLYITNRNDWRDWLENNHSTTKEIWLIHFKKHTGKPSITYDDAVKEALCFGWIDGLLKRIDDEKYALRYSPRRSRSIWSELNKKRVKKMIKQGRMTDAGLAKINEAKENGEWQKATKREDLTDIPPELKEALAANKKAQQNFNNFAPSYRKQYIWWVTSAKKDETRQRRINEIVRLAEENKRPGIQ